MAKVMLPTTFDSMADARDKFAGSSERRKAQNRASQKTYREKRKKLMQELVKKAAETQPRAESVTSTISRYTPSDSGLPSSMTWSGRPPPRVTIELFDRELSAMSMPGTPSGSESPPDSTPDLCPLISVERRAPPRKTIGILPFDISQPYSLSRRPFQHFPEEVEEEEIIPTSSALNVTFTPASTSYATPDFTPSYAEPYLANCYINHITLLNYSFVNGFHINALQIGIQPHEICDDTESRFFRPGLADSPFKDVLVESIKCSFENLTLDLRPSEAQITISHNPYIDVLPFPKVRERMIVLALSPCSTPSSLVEPELQLTPGLDEDELCEDLARGGLVCWGTVDAARYGGMEGKTGGQPWEKGSWEAMEWFLEKWKVVLGDENEEGGLWEISHGWRERRGEYIMV